MFTEMRATQEIVYFTVKKNLTLATVFHVMPVVWYSTCDINRLTHRSHNSNRMEQNCTRNTSECTAKIMRFSKLEVMNHSCFLF
jgi:hypothetical protein